MRIFLILTVAICLSGCGPSQAQQDATNALSTKRAVAQIGLFKDCMELAAKNSRQGDDDVADLVDECASVTYYMAKRLIR